MHVAILLHAAESDHVDTAILLLSDKPSCAGTCMLEEYVLIDCVLFIYIKISTLDLYTQARHCLPLKAARQTYLNQV